MRDDGLRHRVNVRLVFDDRAAIPLSPSGAAASSDEPQGRARLVMVMGLFSAVFVVLAIRLAMVSFSPVEQYVARSAGATADVRPLVVDQNGRPLILNRDATGFAVNGKDVWDVDEAVRTLVGLFPDTDALWLRQRLTQKKYAQILPSITPEQKRKVIATGLPGLVFPRTTARAYPQKDLAAHVVGYTIPGRGGASGIERAVDNGALAAGEGPITVSIDLVAQQILEDELAAAMLTYDAPAAWGVLMHAKTGEVRAIASLPDFNPNRPGSAAEGAWRNRAMSDVYELGSAFKPLSIAFALEEGAVRVEDTYDVSKPLDVGGWPIRDYSVKTFPLTVSEVIQYSSNIGTVKIVDALGKKKFLHGLRSVGLLSPVKTELPESQTPMVPQKWRPIEVATASYGHGIAVTPLHLTAAFASVVNGGEYIAPTFEAGKASARERVFSPSTSAQMRLILRKTITDGTGRNAEVGGFYPIGKTATADKPDGGAYRDDGELISSFIGAFPGYDPEYVLLVSVDEPKGTKKTYGYATAGYVAAPIFRRVVERVAPPLGLMPVGDDVAFDGFVGLRKEAATVGRALPAPILLQGTN